MGILDKVGSAIKKVSDIAGELGNDDGAEGSLVSKLLKSETAKCGKEGKKNSASAYKPPKYEALRPLARTALMKDEVSERDMEVMKRKATSLGMDADEFEMLFEGLVKKKQSTVKKNLFGKKVDDGSFFADYDEEEMEDESMFDREFDKLFLSTEEQYEKRRRKEKELDDRLEGLGGLGGITELLG